MENKNLFEPVESGSSLRGVFAVEDRLDVAPADLPSDRMNSGVIRRKR
jgi:hypothetical protein